MPSIATFWSDWQRAHAALELDVKWLAAAGWTIPLSKPPDIVNALRNAPGDLDRAFVLYYTTGHGAQLKGLWETLLKSRGLRRWRRLLAEAVESYKDKRYAVVIPALLLAFEGAVALAAQNFHRNTSPARSAAGKCDEISPGMRRLIWLSIRTFCELVFAHAPFSEKRPITLNRHWVMHGRDAAAWVRRRECIRLFHALDTLVVMVDRIR